MKRRKNSHIKRIPGALWNRAPRFGAWSPTFAFDQRRGSGIEYQVYGVDSENKLLWAGVSRHERMNRAVANGVLRVWKRERREYVHPLLGAGTPASPDRIEACVRLIIFPIDQPAAREIFEFPPKL